MAPHKYFNVRVSEELERKIEFFRIRNGKRSKKQMFEEAMALYLEEPPASPAFGPFGDTTTRERSLLETILEAVREDEDLAAEFNRLAKTFRRYQARTRQSATDLTRDEHDLLTLLKQFPSDARGRVIEAVRNHAANGVLIFPDVDTEQNQGGGDEDINESRTK